MKNSDNKKGKKKEKQSVKKKKKRFKYRQQSGRSKHTIKNKKNCIISFKKK